MSALNSLMLMSLWDQLRLNIKEVNSVMEQRKFNLVVTGLAGHGKDTVCEILRDKYGYSFESSSRVLLKEVIFPSLKDKYGYADEDECYQDRVNHRAEWFELLKDYNKDDKARLGKLIFSQFNIYCGLRNIDDLEALLEEGVVDFVIWVSANGRLGITEHEDSITITEKEASYILLNDSTLDDLHDSIELMMDYLDFIYNEEDYL